MRNLTIMIALVIFGIILSLGLNLFGKLADMDNDAGKWHVGDIFLTLVILLMGLLVLSHIRYREAMGDLARKTSLKKPDIDRGPNFHKLFNSLEEGMCLHEIIRDRSGKAVDYRITDVNPSYERILGIKREKAIGKPASKLYGSDEVPYLERYARVASSGEAISFETYFPPMKKYFAISAFLYGPDNFATLFSDITLKKRTQRMLLKNLEHYRNLIDKTNDVAFSLDAEGRFTYVSPQINRLGLSPAKRISGEISEIAIPEDRGMMEEEFKRIITTGEESPVIFRSTDREENLMWFEGITKVKKNRAGRAVGLTGVLRDLTDRKALEQSRMKIHMIGKMLAELNEVLMRDPDETALLNEACRIILEVGGYRFAWIGYAQEDEGQTIRPMAYRGFSGEIFEKGKVSWGENEMGQNPAGRAIRTGRPSTGHNLKIDFLQADREKTVEKGFALTLALPLKRVNKPFAVLNIYSGEEYVFDETDVVLLTELADRLALGISISQRSHTEHERSERALLESETRFSAFMDHLPAGVFIKDESSRVLYVNRYMREHFDAEKWIGKFPYEYLPKGAADSMVNVEREILKKGHISTTGPITDVHGVERIFQTDKFAIERKGNPPLMGAVELDITDRKRAEEELKIKLIEAQNLYEFTKGIKYSDTMEDLYRRSLSRICSDFSFERGLLFSVDDIHDSLELVESLGFTNRKGAVTIPLYGDESLLTKAALDMDYFAVKRGRLPSDDRRIELPRILAETMGFPGPEDSYIIAPIHAKNMSFGVMVLDFKNYESFPRDSINRLAMYLSTVGTVFENVRLYHSLESSYERLKEIDRIRGDFIDVAAHELRTPLSSLKIYTDMMGMGKIGIFTDEENTYLTDMNKNIGKLNKLIVEMLDFTRTRSRILDISPEEFDLADIIKQVMNGFTTIAATKGITMKYQGKGDTTARFDRELMEKVVTNLVSNAMKYSPREGSITLEAEEKINNILVAVKDNGPGIVKEHLPRIFERFYIGDTSLTREKDKMGLGLPIAKAIIESHGGKIYVESEPGKGSTFSFFIPKN